MTRAFVAVRPPDAVLDEVGRVVEALAPAVGGARWTVREQWHITLQFLGNRADVDAVTAALAGLTVPAFAACLGGVGAFPSARRARVVWVGVVEGADGFGALAREVGARLVPLGHEPEDRPFHAHLTLARCKVPGDVRESLAGAEAVVAVVGEPWRVDAVTVYESALRRAGAQYTPRATVPLRMDARDA
ncbi:MAG TPA: RNA 2',3'-cyclic phosphodiesterase [Acidimicrobiia bacterium]|nr:RNA 2',3'-cyclic phosphodiesterase [Acidimicrobiia bacterium]